ncbi:hypothetical protein N6H18_09925 [Reichenbachiella agarivorans]|uniref:Uncharacterized protein n=1 Tax=Reichenbachiella agarivorans TaxID=2979464 RepID=A0ABY6CJH0_9BACT|nr:hypothetical protein [Reichenbachiella agarivorans]UXP30671.1 hypothetical protein N6H18_09925 [Reichenbachiella agarivorans]
MADNLLRSELNQLERKLILLLNDFKKKDSELEVLKAENYKLKEVLEEKNRQIEGFQNKDKISKIVNGMVVDERDTEALGNLLNEYIIEVDKCIAQLSE